MEKYETWSWKQQDEYESDLEKIYSLETADGFPNNYTEEVAKDTGLYGELTESAVEHMLEIYNDYFNDPDGVFYDIGSGTGKVVCHVALGSSLSKVCGVELDNIRFDKSIKLAESLNFPKATPQFINEDFMIQDYSDATIMYFDNTMWNDHMTDDRRWLDKFFETIEPGTLIMTKEPLPYVMGHLKMIELPTSYSRSTAFSLIYFGLKP